MKYEDLDSDTRRIIESMCHNTGKTKEQAILALVEFGMVGMVAAICQPKDKIMKGVFDAVINDEKLKKTAEAYSYYWSFGI